MLAEHLRPHFSIWAHDNKPDAAKASELGPSMVSFESAAACPIVVLSVPVSQLRILATRLAPLLQPGTLVLDVGSVKVEPAKIMEEVFPDDVDVVATHPLFGPQSARDGLRGLRIALCPIRGRRFRVAAFCRKLGLEVIMRPTWLPTCW
ncbi:prephenate dehydrogenase/arogenate dehydrogenase family protein [Rhizobium sp. 42MFCr.1]|uniref:prephenate dehydrogenase/arogenate dehydrogenase family protein n=1 Tax=Rhizobium sp. 42MFCr.1 TaxID=1048680 RepID=UPI001FD8D925|nr:prephenate dehydrogenase/arogenate dehydrogenase family protein [Rhizobium sp. 42MFCr.1]